MKTETVEIPAAVLASVETLDELQDRLTAQNPKIIDELPQPVGLTGLNLIGLNRKSKI
jgi:hypothetical protein